MSRTIRSILALSVIVSAGCDEVAAPTQDAAVDAPTHDAAVDAPTTDAAIDAPVDAPVDAIPTFVVTVTASGNGAGTVSSSPTGINCGSDCTEAYPTATTVTLTAMSNIDSTFAGWAGGGCTGTGTCVVTADAAVSVNAAFTLRQYTLTVARAGAGTGAVTSSPAGINCGADCTEIYDSGAVVVLTAAPAGTSTFGGWTGGGCSGTGTCTATISAAVTITATFDTGGITRIGHATQFSESGATSPNILLGEQIVVPSNVTLRQFGLITATSGVSHVIMALYTDAGGAPGTLVAQTASTLLAAGNLEMNTTAGFIPLAAGTYWIMAIYDGSGIIYFTTMAPGNVVAYRSLPFTSALPSLFGVPVTLTGQSYNYYLVVQ